VKSSTVEEVVQSATVEAKQGFQRITVHYSDFEGLSMTLRPPVQIYCKRLVEQGITGQLWIYPNDDVNCIGYPDVIYPSITRAANDAAAAYRHPSAEIINC
jgi:hypothetical protein